MKIKEMMGFLINAFFYFYYLIFIRFKYVLLIKFLSFFKIQTILINIKDKDKKIPMLLSTKDKGITLELLTGKGMREPDNVREFTKLLRKNEIDTIVDLGSNIGFFILLESLYYKKKHLGIEPIKKNFELLKRNVNLNKLSNVELYNIALGDKNGFVNMSVPLEGNWARVDSTRGRIEQVKMQLMEDFFNENKVNLSNALIRCDIEGYEYELFKYNLDFMKNFKNFFFVLEFHPHLIGKQKSKEFKEMVSEAGFTLENTILEVPHHILCLPTIFRKAALFAYKLRIGWYNVKVEDRFLTAAHHLFLHKK